MYKEKWYTRGSILLVISDIHWSLGMYPLWIRGDYCIYIIPQTKIVVIAKLQELPPSLPPGIHSWILLSPVLSELICKTNRIWHKWLYIISNITLCKYCSFTPGCTFSCITLGKASCHVMRAPCNLCLQQQPLGTEACQLPHEVGSRFCPTWGFTWYCSAGWQFHHKAMRSWVRATPLNHFLISDPSKVQRLF